MAKLFVAIVVLMILTGSTVEMRSFHRIGSRVDDDRLIITDTLHSPTTSETPQNHTISFRHPVTMVITCIDLYSDANVHADFVLSFDSVLHGVITAINALEFELTVSVFGIDFKDVPKDFNSPLSPKTQYSGVLTSDIEEEYLDLEYDNYENTEEANDVGIEIMSIGVRQPGDKLIFRDFQSSDGTELPTRHEVTFRFIDSYLMTYVEFKTFDKYNATAVFSHLTESSIKAVIHAENATALDVECKVYGYASKDKPNNYLSLAAAVPATGNLKQVMCNNSQGNFLRYSLVFFVIAVMFIFLV